MGFRKPPLGRRKLMLYPLMDMFFMLLLFFLVTAGMKPKKGIQVENLHTTPSPELGRAQILIQVMDNLNVIWLDNSSFDPGWEANFPKANQIVGEVNGLYRRLDNFIDRVGLCTGEKIVTVIRCPADVEFSVVERLERNLTKALDSLESVTASINEGTNGPLNRERKLEFSLVEGAWESLVSRNVDVRRAKVTIRW